ncbi:unnamed protein product [Rotaria magnacalcarata]
MIDEKSSSSILISRGILELTHYKSHEHPQLLNIDEIFNVEIILSGICVCIPAGSRLRLALSTSYWPIVWPAPQLSTLTIYFNELSSCTLTLPCLNEKYSTRNDFDLPEICQGIPKNDLRDSSINRFRIFDEISEIITLKINEDCGSTEYPDVRNQRILNRKQSSTNNCKNEILQNDPTQNEAIQCCHQNDEFD